MQFQDNRGHVRRWVRYSVKLSLRVLVSTPAGAECMLATGWDVSRGGMALYVPAELETGNVLDLELLFPGSSEPWRLHATVRNREGFKYGVEFLQPAPEQQNAIAANLSQLARTET